MNMSNEERFCELAHKALAKEAQPAEQVELQTLLAGNPKLKDEFDEMGAEAAAAREILPLLEGIQHPERGIPQPPMGRLKAEVGTVFERPHVGRGELRELLARLERWALGQVGAEREHVTELVSTLRRSLMASRVEPAGGVTSLQEANLLATPLVAFASTQPGTRSTSGGETEEAKKREAEIENRLRSLEGRIRQAEQITHECRQEVRGLLEVFERAREMSERNPAQNPNPSSRE